MSRTTRVHVAVVALRGGAALRRTLDAVAWADARSVVDPGGRAADATLPAGVARTAAPDGGDGWLLLLADDEVPDAGLAAAVRAAVAAAGGAWRLPRTVDALGLRFRLRHAPVRLVPDPAAMRLEPGLDLALDAPAPGGRRLAAGVVADRTATLDAAVPALDADASGLAALLAARGARPHSLRLVGSALVAAGRILVATAERRERFGRWIVAVLSGYRALVAQAKLWERTYAPRPEVRP